LGKSSKISGFYKLSPAERLKLVQDFSNLSKEEVDAIQNFSGLKLTDADRMVENVIGLMSVPLGIAVNFLINDTDYLIPMAIEEPSVIAAASNAARIARLGGGFQASNTGPVMIGQIQTVDIEDPYGGKMSILESKNTILEKANEQDPILVKLGGGAKDVSADVIDSIIGPMVVTNLLVDCRDAMGANAVNTMAEAVAPLIEEITGGKVNLRIISNLASERLVRSKAIFPKEALGGEEVVVGVVAAYAFAAADPYRCATHNKGIMNGVSAVALATGQDTRALEAGAHSFAAISGEYLPLTTWEQNEKGDLVGTIEIPMAVGLIGGATAVHPVAKACKKILGIKSAVELGEVMASVGLAQNLAALRALSSDGIQKGHMKLHARNLAISAGAKGKVIDEVTTKMIEEQKVRFDRAKELVDEISGKS
jgi:hydroxymethylglutaryl-CoA reductase|tara:strand:+ start:3676 stop:4947 length:1272 start_codon:yes stop_codon:yes gene_type:complete